MNGKRRVTPDMALRLARYFGNSAQFWLNLQLHYDLEKAEDEVGTEIERRIVPREDLESTSVQHKANSCPVALVFAPLNAPHSSQTLAVQLPLAPGHGQQPR